MVSLGLTSSAFALNYSNRQGNKATFETLEEARVSSPAAALQISGKGNFKSHPVLDGYPKGTTYVYRSENLWGGRANRCNTNIVVFAEKSFQNKDAALAYLKDLGIINIIDTAIGSAVLVTPSDPKTGFAAVDQKHYYALQTAMLSLGASERSNNVVTTYSDGDYFGGFGFLYVIGIDGGATFFNNYIASTFDYASRIAGVLLINGKMEEVRKVASILPAYLVNATEAVEAGYKAANKTNAAKGDAGTTTYFNQSLPLQQVIVHRESNPNPAAIIKRAYDGMFSKIMRIPVIKQGLHSAGTPYQGYNFDQAPYSLAPRNVVTNGVAPDGISVFPHQEDRFSGIKTKAGEYMVDTAAGSCGFTVHTIFQITGHLFQNTDISEEEKENVLKVFGIDFDEKVVRVARTLNLIAGDGNTNVLHLNNLDYERWNESIQNRDWLEVYGAGLNGLKHCAKIQILTKNLILIF
jgi:hypothetical protein